MRVLVCGGRQFDDWYLMKRFLDGLHLGSERFSVVIHGCARGADEMAEKWARQADVDFLRFYADWEKDGRAAGPIRNARMLTEGRPDLVIAFPGGKGTADMISRARKAGVKVMVVE